MIGREAEPEAGFTVGICATGEAVGLGRLVRSMAGEAGRGPCRLLKLVVVASDCPRSTLAEVRQVCEEDPRVHLVVEDARRGKAEAINRILSLAGGEFVVLVNSDAVPERGALTELLGSIRRDEKVGAVSAVPIPSGGRGPASLLSEFMWTAHNDCSLALNHMNLSNHSSDELVAFRLDAIRELPEGSVNDGAYLAMIARIKGFSIKVCQSARVRIRTPSRVSDLVSQRRRIIFGHTQVWRRTGVAPKTIESLIIFSPLIGTRILIATVARRPAFLFALPIALVGEVLASVLSIVDAVVSSRRHVVWRRFA